MDLGMVDEQENNQLEKIMEQDSDDQRADSAEEDPLYHIESANRKSELEPYTFKCIDRSQKFKFKGALGSESSQRNNKNTKQALKMSVDG